MEDYKYEKQLIIELKKIRDDRDFILGILSFAETEENFEKCLEFIEQGVDVTEPNLIMLATDLGNEGTEAYEKYWKIKK